MNTNGMYMPEGYAHAVMVDGMRELCNYDIYRDDFQARWDTFIGNTRYTVKKWMRDNVTSFDTKKSPKEFAESEREDSKLKLQFSAAESLI